jgi:hypothetical protein
VRHRHRHRRHRAAAVHTDVSHSHAAPSCRRSAAVAAGTEVGKKAKALMAAGALVGDDVVVGIIKDRIQVQHSPPRSRPLQSLRRRARASAETVSARCCWWFFTGAGLRHGLHP